MIHRLKLAAWLHVNRQRLVRRELDINGKHITYYFEMSLQIDALVQQWLEKCGQVDLVTLAKFAEAVSLEIRIATRIRRGEPVSELQAKLLRRKAIVDRDYVK